jgi:hypothetical protein
MSAKRTTTIYLFPDGTRERAEEPLPFRHEIGDLLPFEQGTFQIEALDTRQNSFVVRLRYAPH